MTREEATLALCKLKMCYISYDVDDLDEAKAIDVAIEALKEEPRPTGKWVPYEFGDEKWHKCTNCNKPSDYKERVQHFDGKWHWYVRVQNYCPKCGAKMEEEK